MQDSLLSDEELLSKLDRSVKECKLFQMYLEDVNDDYGKIKIAKLKFEFAKHEYLKLLKEVKARGLKVADEDKCIAKLLFN
ncbi:MAG: hypothetical protein PWR27_1869 [Petroclostridium sp.]|jgi:hypothetical protein|uniref:hypothetical protein n=1 Tax=Petroclostridium xylanilyticum TaxID=1792311 RepID=UPI000B99C050|nr:hypothetical protein [Petroclostridium xylanilyticum]MBZ4644713.1 hypothetical protein [Clostridia bacterium]MDK2811160.1 hypothetical protein [Petroclostridium sp.]